MKKRKKIYVYLTMQISEEYKTEEQSLKEIEDKRAYLRWEAKERRLIELASKGHTITLRNGMLEASDFPEWPEDPFTDTHVHLTSPTGYPASYFVNYLFFYIKNLIYRQCPTISRTAPICMVGRKRRFVCSRAHTPNGTNNGGTTLAL